MLHWPTFPLVDIYPKEMKSVSQKIPALIFLPALLKYPNYRNSLNASDNTNR